MQTAAIVILNFNGEGMLRKFLPSVVRFSHYPIIVADNGSTDGSLDFLKLSYPEVRILTFSENHGFAGGYNLAIKELQGSFKFFILLNSDIETTKDWDLNLIDWLQNNPDSAAVQPKILSFQNPEYFDHAGAGGGFVDQLGYPYCRGRVLGTIEKDNGQYDDTIEVHWASGACMAVRAEAYILAGGFDDRFFAHMEEIDLCWRWRIQGQKIHYIGSVSVKHVGGGTLDKSNPKKTYLNFRNSLLMLHNNLPQDQFFLTYFRRFFLDSLAALVFAFKGEWPHSISVWNGHRDFFRLKAQKKQDPLASKLSREKKLKVVHSIVWEYYVKKNKTYQNL